MVVWTMLTITHLLSEEYIYISHNDDVCKPQKRLMYNTELTSSIIHIFVKSVLIMIINQITIISTINILKLKKAHDPTIYINLTELTKHLKNLTERTLPKILSVFLNNFSYIGCKKLKPTFPERAKFSPSARYKNVVFNPFPSVKSMINQSENTTKCKHVHHFGFVLVDFRYSAVNLAEPETIIFYNGRLWPFAKSCTRQGARGGYVYVLRNKYTYKLTRFDNKCHETLPNRTKMHVFTKINGKNSSNTINLHSTAYGPRTFSGIYTNLPTKQPKYQPFACMSKYIIMIIDHNILCIHVHDPTYSLKHTKKGHTTTMRLKIMIYCLNNTNHQYG